MIELSIEGASTIDWHDATLPTMSVGSQFDGFNTLAEIDEFSAQTASQMYETTTGNPLTRGTIPYPFFNQTRQGDRYIATKMRPSYLSVLRYDNVTATVIETKKMPSGMKAPSDPIDPISFAIISELLHPEQEKLVGAIACKFVLYIGNEGKHKGHSSPVANRQLFKPELFDTNQAHKLPGWLAALTE